MHVLFLLGLVAKQNARVMNPYSRDAHSAALGCWKTCKVSVDYGGVCTLGTGETKK